MAVPRIITLANDFPPGLNTAAHPAELQPNESPDAYGFDLTVDGKIKTGTVPTGTSRVQKQAGSTWATSTAYIVNDVVINSSTTYICLVAHTSGTFATDLAANKWVARPAVMHGRRMWLTNGNVLEIGASDYDDHFFPPATRFQEQNLLEDAQSIVSIEPVEPDSLFIAKSTGSYMLRNISDTRGYFQMSDIIQEMACSAADRLIAINNVVYVGNADGVIAYRNFQTEEVSRKIRPTRATVGALAFTADYERNWLILGSSYVFDAQRGRWFNFSGSSFRFTTRTLQNPDLSPFAPDTLYFAIEHGSTVGGTLSYQVKYEDEAWSTARTVLLKYTNDMYSLVNDSLADSRSARRFAVRLTALSSNVYVRSIQIEGEDMAVDDYST